MPRASSIAITGKSGRRVHTCTIVASGGLKKLKSSKKKGQKNEQVYWSKQADAESLREG